MLSGPDPHPMNRIYQAVAMQQEGRFDEAELLFMEQLQAFPNDVAALYSMGAIEHRRGSLRLAVGYMRRALVVRPDFEMAANAVRSLEAALEQQKPSDSSLLEITRPEQREALSLQSEGRIDEARALFERILLDNPDDFIAVYSIAIMIALAGQTTDALEWLERAEGIRPDFSPLHYTKGTLLQRLGLLDGALAAFDRAIELKQDNLDALNNRASLLQMMDRDYDAVQSLLKALAYKPDDPKLLSNVGIGLTTLKRHALAVPYFDRLMHVNPDYDYAAGYRFFAKLHACDWSRYEEHRSEVIKGVDEGRRVVNPMAFCAMSDDPALQLRCARMFSQHRYAVPREPLWRGTSYKHRKLRLGYLSPDFREHPVGHLMVGVIEQHDKTRFETFAFSLGANDGSRLRQRFKLGFDHFLDCRDKTSGEIAQLIRSIEIDVLVDLAGFTAGSRAEIFAMRPAPIHVNFLGYPCTMGAQWMDFILADRVVIPEGEENHYQEKVVRLPYCYLPIDDSLHASEHTPPRQSFGLPEHGLVFCSFNHDYKINPPIWSSWMSLLHKHPGSVLWLMKLNDDAMQNLKIKAQAFDVDPDRVVFATRVPRVEDHLARYRLADVFLDTTPYNAHSTATDVLRSGLPIVTMPGRTFASRVAYSVMHHVGALDGGIARTIDEYQTMASATAQRRHDARDAPNPAIEGKLVQGFPDAKAITQAIEDVFWRLEPQA